MAKRSDGEGTIGQRKDGTFYGAIQLDGKRRWAYGKTRKEVADKLRVFRKQAEQGVSLGAGKTKLEVFLDHWIEEIVKQRNKYRTYTTYKETVRLYLKPMLGHYTLEGLKPDHVQSMLNKLTNDGKSPGTVRNTRAVLRRALNQAMRWQYIGYNAATLVDVPRVEQYEVNPLTREEALKLIEALKGHRLEALYLIALMLGLREGELLALSIENIDLIKQTITVNSTLIRKDKQYQRQTTKTRASIRKLPIPPQLVPVVTAHIEQQRQQFPDSDYAFTTRRGTPIAPRGLIDQFRELLAKAGIRIIRFHDLRHTCATFLIAIGEHPRTVMEILGHSQISTTMNTYGHTLDETKVAAIQGLGKFLGDAV